jgi:hypothetical protein
VEPLTALAAYLTGLLLRIIVPVTVTALFVWLLRKLDGHWQSEAEQVRPRMVNSLPCWVMRNCPTERRAQCQAFLQHDVPCWQMFRDPGGHLREACLTCQVFRRAPVPAAVRVHA